MADALDDKAMVLGAMREILDNRRLVKGFTSNEWYRAVKEWRHGPSRHSDIDGSEGYEPELRSRMAPLLGLSAPSGRPTSLYDLSRRMGATELARLVLAKGKETGVIREHEEWSGDELLVIYRMNRPSGGTDPK